MIRNRKSWVVVILAVLLISWCAVAQETTAGLQGTVKDSSGGAIAKATVEVTSPALIGVKKVEPPYPRRALFL